MGFASHIVSGSKLPIKVSLKPQWCSMDGPCYNAWLEHTGAQYSISANTSTAQLCPQVPFGRWKFITLPRFTLRFANLPLQP